MCGGQDRLPNGADGAVLETPRSRRFCWPRPRAHVKPLMTDPLSRAEARADRRYSRTRSAPDWRPASPPRAADPRRQTLDRHSESAGASWSTRAASAIQLGRFDHAHDVRKGPRSTSPRTPGSTCGASGRDTITHADPALGVLETLVGPTRMVIGHRLPFDMADQARSSGCGAWASIGRARRSSP